MTVRRVERTEICWDHKNPPGPEEAERLNEDFKTMCLPLRITIDVTPDGIMLIFTKDEDL